MSKLAFVFRHSPLGSAASREGLDALLAASAFCDEQDIAVYFMDDGVLNLVQGQQPDLLLQKDVLSAFKLLDLYDIQQRYVCQQSWQKLGLDQQPMQIFAEKIHRTLLIQQLQQAEKVLTF